MNRRQHLQLVSFEVVGPCGGMCGNGRLGTVVGSIRMVSRVDSATDDGNGRRIVQRLAAIVRDVLVGRRCGRLSGLARGSRGGGVGTPANYQPWHASQ